MATLSVTVTGGAAAGGLELTGFIEQRPKGVTKTDNTTHKNRQNFAQVRANSVSQIGQVTNNTPSKANPDLLLSAA